MPKALPSRVELEAELTAADLEYRMALRAKDTVAADAAAERFDTAVALWRSIPAQRRASA